MSQNQTHTTSWLSFPLKETTFIAVKCRYESSDLKRLKVCTRLWENGKITKTTLFQRLQIPHSLPVCNSLNVSSPTFPQLNSFGSQLSSSQLDASILLPLSSQLDSYIPQPSFPFSSQLDPSIPMRSFSLPSQLDSSSPQQFFPIPSQLDSSILQPSFPNPSQMDSSIPQQSFPILSQLDYSIPHPSFPVPSPLDSFIPQPSLPLQPTQIDSSVPQPSFPFQQDYSIPTRSFSLPSQMGSSIQSPSFPLCPLMAQSLVTSSLSDLSTSFPGPQDILHLEEVPNEAKETQLKYFK